MVGLVALVMRVLTRMEVQVVEQMMLVEVQIGQYLVQVHSGLQYKVTQVVTELTQLPLRFLMEVEEVVLMLQVLQQLELQTQADKVVMVYNLLLEEH
jgi:hypothetical protein